MTSVLISLAGCGTGPGDIYAIWSEFRGVVTTSSDIPVAVATVELRLMYGGPAAGGEVTCQLGSSEETVMTSTNETGAFSKVLQATSIFPPNCVQVSVFPAAGSGLDTAVDTALVAGWSMKKDAAPVTLVQITVVPHVQ